MTIEKKTVFITQARTGSTRLPGKVMKKIGNRTVISWFLQRSFRCSALSKICVATTNNEADDSLVAQIKGEFPQVHITRGSEEDVLSRYAQAAEETGADVIVRVTSDCPYFDWNLVDRCVVALTELRFDAVRTLRNDFPIGLDVEVFNRSALETAHKKASTPYEREHVGPYIFDTHASEFSIHWMKNSGPLWPECRLTLDYAEDFMLLEKLYNEVGPTAPSEEYRLYLISHPEVAQINLTYPH